MFLYTVFCMERQVDFLILRTRPHTQELSLSANMCDENVKLACVAIIIYLLCPPRDWEILNHIYVNQSHAEQTLAELTDEHSMNRRKKKKREVDYHIIYN
jgi:hypothetical protein